MSKPAATPQPPRPTLWQAMRREAETLARAEPMLASFFHTIILNHSEYRDALSFHLANKLASHSMPALVIREIFDQALAADPAITRQALADCAATRDRDPAARYLCTPFLYLKGYQALQSHRVAHWLWTAGRQSLALFLQSRIAEVFSVDIHPAARIGSGIMLDHATGIVIGETAVVEDDVSILQSVTLGGTGKESGDRHPKIRRGVLVGVGAKILGNVEIGAGAKIGAGSVVLTDVAPHTTVVGVPALPVGTPKDRQPSQAMDHNVLLD